MTLEEYYNMEKEYEEYGYANCKKHDIPEECTDTEKCNDWA